jgi:CrcB protein
MSLQLALVALGGALGALLRFGVNSGVTALVGRGLPLATLTVNAVGGFAAGVLYVLLVERGAAGAEAWRAFLLVGFLGALTTFSAFSVETLTLLESGRLAAACANVVANVVLALGACWLGLVLGRG